MTGKRRRTKHRAGMPSALRGAQALLLACAGVVVIALVFGGSRFTAQGDVSQGAVLDGGQEAAAELSVSSPEVYPAAPPLGQRAHEFPIRASVAPPGSPLTVQPGVHLRKRPPSKAEQAKKLAAEAEKLARVQSISSFVVASFNILGSQHTRGKSGYGPGTARALNATRYITSRGASIVGFSEIQRDQLSVFRRNAPGYGVYPGESLGSAGVPTTLAWNTGVWSLKEAWTFNIPFSGQIRPAPVVRLANVATGAEIWAVNVHNSPRGMQAERDRAMAIEVGIFNKLAASGLPVVVTGDFNEKAQALCRVTSATPLVSAVGGSGCAPPRGARVDWIFASPSLTVESYVADRSAPIPSITDHAVMLSRLRRS